ncbi:MAG: hypothetical protein ACTHJW_24565 [Streptosporangiaceae bacterium]
MIRRGFWMLLGAAMGISGYRRITRAARALLQPGALVSHPQGRTQAIAPARGSAGRAGAETIAFVRDVRAGMADYLDRHREI